MNINFLNIIDDYERLVKTEVKIPLEEEIIINFIFKPNHLPHLLGLNRLVDIPILLDYKNQKKKAIEIYNGIREGSINGEEFKKSKYYQEVHENKLKYFSSDRIMSLIKSTEIIKFNPNEIKSFTTKLEKVDYLFFELINKVDKNYVHFGIAFTNENNKNQPNTFFIRHDDDYVKGQDFVYPNSIFLKDKDRNITFKIYWKNIRKNLGNRKNKHYKELNKLSEKYKYQIENLTLKDIENFKILTESVEEINKIEKHFRLLRLDEIRLAYIPYISEAKVWNNKQKQYLVEIIDKSKEDILPNIIKMKLNEFHE
ncbi:MAG: PBECR4 domain-containing protein [Sarcina sp.]